MSKYFERMELGPGVNRLAENSCPLLDFEMLVLRPGDRHEFATADREYAVVGLSGIVAVEVGGQEFTGVGGRVDVFTGKPSMVYAPAGNDVTITAEGGAEVALCSAPGDPTLSAYVVRPADVVRGTWGVHNTTRHHEFLIDAARPSARLFVAEVTVASGNWATYPPHRHEVDDPVTGELLQEEMYFYRVAPRTGFGLCALYGERVGGDNAFVVRHDTVHKMPAGYHVVTAAPGYRVWYLAFFAGNAKAASPLDDPHHTWYRQAEVALAAMGEQIRG
jgi:5-deoxy-glucuronate isomerase